MKLLCVMPLAFFGLMETLSARLKVVGPDAPLVAVAGEDLVLPCSLQPSTSVEDMMVEWFRPHVTDSVVHLYVDREDRTQDQTKSYRGRTALFKEELKKGNASLKLSALQPSDDGAYTCLIRDQSFFLDDVTLYVEVKVELKVVGPDAPLVAVAGEDLILPCSLQPSTSVEDVMIEWFRHYETDKTVHLYVDREDRTQDQMESYRGRTALFKEELKKGNASLKLSALQPSDDGAYTCLIRNQHFFVDHVTLYVEVKGKGFQGWKIAIISISVFAVVFTAFAVYILKDKHSKKQLTPTECSIITYTRLHTAKPRQELDLRKFNTTQEGYRRLIPAVANCRKALLTGCKIDEKSVKALSEALQSTSSPLKELDLSYTDLQGSRMEDLSAGLKSLCKLEILRLTGCEIDEESVKALSEALQSTSSTLKELDLSYTDLQGSRMEELSAGLKSLCKLEILRLTGCRINEESVKALSEALQSTSSPLKELDLSYTDLQGSRMEELPAGLKSLCKLEILRLTDCYLNKESFEALIAALHSEDSSLKELDLSYNNLWGSGKEELSAGLKSLCKLEIVRLTGCRINEESVEALSEALQSTSSSLKELDLSYNDLQGTRMEKLSAGLKSLCQLEILRLALCNLGKQFCENLASMLNLENSLKELDLSNNDLEDSGVKLLSAELKSSHCKLELLRLSGCMITETGCSSLASSLSSNPSHLKELDLTYNNPGRSGEELLSVKLKDEHFSLKTLRIDHGGNTRITAGLKKYFCRLTLDPNTAHRFLHLSENNRAVEWRGDSRPLNHPERFDSVLQVLSKESVSGRSYWEVEWREGRFGGVSISVSYKEISRRGRGDECWFGRNDQSWSLDCFSSSSSPSFSHNNIQTKLPVRPSSRIGVYVDQSAGILSFYNISTETMSLLHTVHTSFTKPLHAGFRVWGSVELCDF